MKNMKACCIRGSTEMTASHMLPSVLNLARAEGAYKPPFPRENRGRQWVSSGASKTRPIYVRRRAREMRDQLSKDPVLFSCLCPLSAATTLQQLVCSAARRLTITYNLYKTRQLGVTITLPSQYTTTVIQRQQLLSASLCVSEAERPIINNLDRLQISQSRKASRLISEERRGCHAGDALSQTSSSVRSILGIPWVILYTCPQLLHTIWPSLI